MAELLVLWHRWLPRRADETREPIAVAAWRRTVAARLAAGGGEVVPAIGAAIVATFDPAECADAVEIALDLLDEAEAADIDVALAAALGVVHAHEDGPIGDAFERAQQLANRARAGELVLDAHVRDAVREEFLFGRQVAGAWRGTTVDRDNPRRVETADAIADLPVARFPPIGAPLVAEMALHLDTATARTFILRGPVGAGAAELVAELAREQGDARILELGAAPGGVVPLASLRFALSRQHGSPEGVHAAARAAGASPTHAETLARVADGALPDHASVAAALAALLAGTPPAWTVLSPLSQIDAASLAVLLEARERCDFVIFGRLPTEAPLPTPLAALAEPVVEHVIPALKTADARLVAEQILGPSTDPDVARQVAVLGGDTVIGVVEAARTLIATGEVVRGDGDAFVWRAGPRRGVDMISTDELLSERIDLLDGEARQVLETLCVAPDGAARDLIESVAARDGIGPATFDRSLERLVKEAFARDEARPRPTSSLLRWRMLELIPAARSMELHRFVGEALAAHPHEHAPLRAELAYYLVEGGRHEEGRPLAAAAVEALVEAGYRRAATHLSSWIASTTAESAEGGAARPTPVPPAAEARDEGPASNELALGELLDELAEEPRRTTTPPPRAALPREERDLRSSEPALDALLDEIAAAAPPPPAADVARAPSSPPRPPTSAPVGRPSTAPPPPPSRRATSAPPAARTPPPPRSDRPRPPPPPPRRPLPPLPPAHEIVELSADEVELFDEASGANERLELDLDGLRSSPEVPLGRAVVDETAEHPALPAGVAAGPLELSGLRSSDWPADEEEGEGWLDHVAPTAAGARADDAGAADDDDAGEPDSDETMLTDAAELMAALRAAPAASGDGPPTVELEPPSDGATNVGPAPERSFVEEATQLMRAGAFDALDRAIQRAVAEGADLAAIGRVRAIAQLARGEVAQAKASLDDARARGRDDRAERGRYELAMALLSLRSGDAIEGVRRGLGALACARGLGDARGEEAALKTLAACYRALGRDADAERLDHV
ncbi:MAG: hypothetical protein KF729_19860 [Sandaracinaceae bacterium]|nr:hypothetical protein [Sandaracinaceae bacterium]